MSGVLVDYRCSVCGEVREQWVSRPLPAEMPSPCCAGVARRRFGGQILAGAQETSSAPTGQTCGSAGPAIPGSCALTPTAARSLSARVRGDRKALDRERRYQERALSRGELNPSPVAPFTGVSPAP